MSTDEKPQSSRPSPLLVLAAAFLAGALALTAILVIAHKRLETTTATDGQDMSQLNRGLIGAGFGSTSPNATGLGQGPVADIAASMVAKAFSFTPQSFDAQVAAAKKLMTSGMQQRYSEQIAAQKTQAAIVLGLQVTTSLVHLNNDPKNVAFIGVVSLSRTTGEFVMYMQRQTTTAGSTQAQVTAFVLNVKVLKVGDTWLLDDVETKF